MRKWLKIVDGDARFHAVSPQPITFFQHQQNPNHGQWPMTFSRIYDLHTRSPTPVVQTLSSSAYSPVVPYVQHVHHTTARHTCFVTLATIPNRISCVGARIENRVWRSRCRTQVQCYPAVWPTLDQHCITSLTWLSPVFLYPLGMRNLRSKRF